jgi:hypothetical protein
MMDSNPSPAIRLTWGFGAFCLGIVAGCAIWLPDLDSGDYHLEVRLLLTFVISLLMGAGALVRRRPFGPTFLAGLVGATVPIVLVVFLASVSGNLD